ncbi:hypothetical protein PZA11_002767 [Diplocarpon coronariae]
MAPVETYPRLKSSYTAEKVGILEAAKSLGLTAVLFLGPLYEAGVAEGGWRDWIRLRGLDAIMDGWIGWRNMVAVSCQLFEFYD